MQSTTDITTDHINPLANGVSQLEAQEQRAQVIDQESLSKAGDFFKIVNTQIKKAEDARTSLVKPLNEHVKFINNQFKPLTTRLEMIKTKIKKKMNVFVEQERKKAEAEAAEAKRKAEEEALKRATEAEAAGDKEGAQNIVEAAANLPDTVPKNDIARGNYGSSTSSRETWHGEVVDKKQMMAQIIAGNLPDDFVIINQSRIDEFARTKKVEKTKWGIKIFRKITAAVR